MSAGNIKDKGSNYGSNYSYQLSVLQLLDSIATGSGGGGCCPTAATEATLQQIAGTVSTEATLQQVLSAVQGGSLFFNNLVIDQGGVGCPSNCPTYSEVKVWNGVGFTTTYYNASGGVVVPVGPLVYVNPQYVLNDIYLQAIAINASTTSIDTKSTNIVTNTGTIATNTTGVTRTPTMSRVSSAVPVTIPANTVRSVSFSNAGLINATVLGANLLPGETVNFDAGSLKDTLGAITYNANGTDLLIITIG